MIHDKRIQTLPDVCAPQRFIHTQIIDVQGPDVRQDVVIPVLLEDAERIA